MPALKRAQPSLPQPEAEDYVRPDHGSSGGTPFHLASELDDPVASPVAEMQADLARKLRRRPQQNLRFDPFWPLATLFSLVCWWGLISLGAAAVHTYLHG